MFDPAESIILGQNHGQGSGCSYISRSENPGGLGEMKEKMFVNLENDYG